MESNIQVLLDKIYEDGIGKSKSEADRILSEARAEADRILTASKTEAQKLMEKTKQDAKILRESTEADLKTALNQTLTSLKTSIAQLIATKTIDPSIREANLDQNFLNELILRITENWMDSGLKIDQIELLIPMDKKEAFEKSLQSLISTKLEGLKIKPAGIKSGFQIIRTDKGFRIDFTEEAMKDFFRSYLRQKTAEWLFKE